MDIADKAQEHIDAIDAARMEKIRRRRLSATVESSEFCNECGQVIPEERRKAVPGVDTCVHCRTIIEEKLKCWRAA